MAQWVKHLPQKYGDLSVNHYHPHKVVRLWQPVYNLSAWEVEAGDPGAKMGIQTTLLCKLEVQGDTLPQ